MLDLMDSGAESPRETWLRLFIVRCGYPRPQTQIRVPWPGGFGAYFLDLGWEDLKLAVEYDGGQHWDDPERIAYDIERAEYLQHVGWNVVRVMKKHDAADIRARLRRAWQTATR